MKYEKVELEKDRVKIVALGDVHIGSANADLKAFEWAVNYIKEHNAKAILMGDLIDAIGPRDRRYDPFNVDRELMNVGEQFTYLEQRLETIQDNIIGSIMGNHFHKYMVSSTANEKQKIAERLNFPFLGYRGVIELELEGGKTYSISLYHGTGGGYEMGSVVNRLRKEPRKFNCDIYLMGHSHRVFSFPAVQLYVNGGIKQRIMHFVNTGSFLKTYEEDTSGYGEQKGYDPLPIGFSEINLSVENPPVFRDVLWYG